VAVSKLFAIFVRKIMAEFHFRSMEASQKNSDVTIKFLVGDLVSTLPELSIYLSTVKSYSRISCLCNGENFFSIWGANMTPKNFFANMQTPKRHFVEKICVD
jgi:hypothetical protein